MKRLATLVFLLGFAVSLAGCGEHKNNEQDTPSYPENTYIIMEVAWNNLLVAEMGEDGKAIETKQYSVPNMFPAITDMKHFQCSLRRSKG